MRILLIEDETDMAALIGTSLRESGFALDVVGTLRAAAAAVDTVRYSLVILDRRLPDGDGLSFVPRVRSKLPGTPLLVVSALDAVGERVTGLDAGVDDYLPKPFDAAELRARVRAALRRGGGTHQPPVRCGRLSVDLDRREVSVDGRPLVLKRRELAVLVALCGRAGRVVQRARLLEELSGFDDEVQSNTLDAHVSRLRTRLVEAGAGVLIHPVRGVGYLLDEDGA